MYNDVINVCKNCFFTLISLSLLVTALSLSHFTQANAQTITVSGTIYTDEGITPMSDGKTVRIKSNGAGDYSDLLDSGDGTYLINNITAESGTTITVYIDNETEKGSTIVVTDSAPSITNLDIYQNHVIVRSFVPGISVDLGHMAMYDQDQDLDISFDSEAGASYTLDVDTGNEFYIWPGSSFHPYVFQICTINVDDFKIPAGASYYIAFSSVTTNVSGNWYNAGNFYNGWNFTVNFTAASGTRYITSGGGSDFYNITFNDGGGGATWILEDTLDVRNDLTITSGTIDVNSNENNSINIKGNWNNSGTFTANLGTVTFNNDQAGSNTITSGGSSFYNLAINPSAAVTYTLQDPINVDNNLSIATGTLDIKSGVHNSINVAGDWTNAGTFNARRGTVTFDDDQASSNTITSGASSFYNLVINPGAAATYTVEDSLDVNNNLTISAGALDTKPGANNAINVEGNWTNDGTFTANLGTVTFDDDTARNRTITSGGSPFYNLTVSPSVSSTYVLQDALDVDNNLTISAGNLDTNAAGNNNINIGVNWLNSSTFVANSSTVTFDGTAAQSVTTGNANWNEIEVTNSSSSGVTFEDSFTASNFTCTTPDAHLTFKSSETFEITDSGGLDLQGGNSQPIVLSATIPGSPWTIDPSGGAWNVSDVDVRDSLNANILYINPSDSIDSGNNYNWFSQDACITLISPSDPSIDSGGSIEFSASNAACSQTPAYSWSVTSGIGSTIDENGLYMAGTHNGPNPVEEDVKVTDTANSVTDTVTVCVAKAGCSVAVSPSSKTLASRGTIQFSATSTGCAQGVLTWELTSSIGSTINASGLYTAGTNSGADTFVDTITLTDTSNCVLDTAIVTIPGYSPPQPTTTTTVSETVISTTTSTIAAVTTTISANTTTTVPCELRLTPQSGTAVQGETITFEVTSSGECNTSTYEWSLSSNTDSTIEVMGTTCIYTAGENYTADPLTDTITVKDTANGGISAVAMVTLNSGEEALSLTALPDSLAKTLFLPYPAWLSLEGTGTHFDPLDSVITLDHPTAIWPLFTRVTDSTNILSFILVMPAWFAGSDNEPVTITVTTGDQSVSATLNIEFVPSMMGEENNIK